MPKHSGGEISQAQKDSASKIFRITFSATVLRCRFCFLYFAPPSSPSPPPSPPSRLVSKFAWVQNGFYSASSVAVFYGRRGV